MPLYYHLLSDRDIERLGPVFRILREKRDEVLDAWYELYLLYFGKDRTFSEDEFKTVFGADLDAVSDTIVRHDIVTFAQVVHKHGEKLLERGVPFEEIVASIHLFEESAAPFFRKLSVLARGFDIPLLFDKLSHVRMILLTRAYFRGFEAAHRVRERELEDELSNLDPKSEHRTHFHGLVGGSKPMRRLYAQIQVAASTRSSVLVSGESGTGKELVARAVHECSEERRAPFIAVNCAALPRDLIESELFGHRKGAFSGATGEYLGLVRAADGGTLLLDEITEMPLETQAKLLRVLQDRRVRPVGGTQEVAVDVRFIASTNRDLVQCVEERLLREDLLYRLKVHALHIPPLRERRSDLAALVNHFLALFNERFPRTVTGIELEALNAMEAYDWPGNVRELMNAMEVAFAYGRSERITLDDLPPDIGGRPARRPVEAQDVDTSESIPTFEESERSLLCRALAATQGNKLRAAKMLGISRKQLYAKIKKYEIQTES